METGLNTFQIMALRELMKLPSYSQNLFMLKDAFLSDLSNADVSEEMLNSWIHQLIDEGYVTKLENVFSKRMPIQSAMSYLNQSIETTEVKIAQKGRAYLALLFIANAANTEETKEPVVNAEIPLQKDEKLTNVENHLGCLRGKWQGLKIMKDEEHENLIHYTYQIVKNCTLPPKVIKIKKSSTIPFEFIRKTFHLIYLQNKRLPKVQIWVDFLHSVFDLNETCTKKSTKENFSTYRGNYPDTKASIILD